jgi:periplasmic divalent cation tolerance protein
MRAMATELVRARVVLVTAPNVETAREIARAWVEQHLAACVNIVPGITSIYRWQGRVEESSEVLLVAKTSADRIGGMEASLGALHPYEVPEFVVLDAAHVAPGYAAWLAGETR